ncbi:MAG: restriction endonuclease [Anaerolineae bacterium]
MTKPPLTLTDLLEEAAVFTEAESHHNEPSLYGVTDGKAVGTYVEHKFVQYLVEHYEFARGNSASGVDLPLLDVDIKVTSIRQPQSSCPFKSARQKIYGLGYHLLIFVYDKSDDNESRTSRLNVLHTIFVNRDRTSDYQMTRGILQILTNDANADDLIAFMNDKNLPVDEIQADRLAAEILDNPPIQGYLTISNAQQWRLQYSRVIQVAGNVDGISRVR